VKQVLLRAGKASLEDVPAPGIEPGTVLVSVERSCISTGTELSGLRDSATPLWRKALQNPEKLARVARKIVTEGLGPTRAAIEERQSAASVTGYSAAGTVLDVGAGVDDLVPGSRVACAGAQHAHHAQVIRVPRNLVAPVPSGIDAEAACTVTLGAIALQGVRRAQPTLGETFVVIGMGILGQLTSQILQANGCKVAVVDLDSSRTELAVRLGADVALDGGDAEAVQAALRLTGGNGVDGVIITAATRSSEVVATAFRMCRKKARVVLVGDVGLDLDRADFYAKELDFLVSCSYGPGRYDARYEEEGLDYPIGYVRWTENRNLSEYLSLLERRKIRLEPLGLRVYPIEEVASAYAALADSSRPRLLGAVLAYPADPEAAHRRVIANPRARAAGNGKVRFGIIGAGEFARAVHLPNLRRLEDRLHVQAIASRTGSDAIDAAKRSGAAYATTDVEKILADRSVDAVLIATRHDSHGRLALAALRAGKHVLVEKPLSIDRQEVDAIESFYASGSTSGERPILMTGFNRRFSPHARRLREIIAGDPGPVLIQYRVNAGALPAAHWVHGPSGGGRNLGEACHFYDLFTYLLAGRAVKVAAESVAPREGGTARDENFVATVRFENGSLATLTYSALGSSALPKERAEVFVGGKVVELDDYRTLRIHGSSAKGLETRGGAKGHLEELEAFAAAVQGGGDWPIPLWQQLQATSIAFEVEAQIGREAPEA
jgi:predicted dehydrogenase/threonine dehydrogenase-like Zn-dependent dehydrogenase